MNDDDKNLDSAKLVTVAERSDEMSASIVISILDEAGIRAVATGGFTSGFRAEAPGMVKIKTLEDEAEKAKAIIAELKVEWPEEFSN